LILPDRPVAAKTGTTNDWHDGWTLGFTPSLAAGVWAGNNDNTAMKQKADGVFVAAPIWHNFMARALKDAPIEEFTAPDPLPPDTKPVLLGQGFGQVMVNINKNNGLLANETTPSELTTIKTYLIPHDLLYYLNKDDPAGPPPTDPAADPQFAGWEAAVAIYAQKNGLLTEEPPTVYDNGETATEKPQISITSPADGSTLANRDLSIQIISTSTSPTKSVAYYLDNVFLATVTEPPFTFDTHLYETTKGFHTVKAVVTNQSGGSAENSIDFNLLADLEPPTALWMRPQDGQAFTRAIFPISLSLRAYQPEKIKKMVVFYTSEAGVKKTLATLSGQPEKEIIISWEGKPTVGVYLLGATLTTIDNKTLQGEGIKIIIN
jgi:membrane carboxypeptidase/penicillin-binding protein PbpC